MPQKSELPDANWLAALSIDEGHVLLGWLHGAAETKPQIAAEFARYKQWLEKRKAAASSMAH